MTEISWHRQQTKLSNLHLCSTMPPSRKIVANRHKYQPCFLILRQVCDVRLSSQSNNREYPRATGECFVLRTLSTLKVSDSELIILEFSTPSLLCAFRSIIDHHLNHILYGCVHHMFFVSDLLDEAPDTGYNISVVDYS